MQAVAAKMKKDDIEENPDSENEYFDCDCCGKTAPSIGRKKRAHGRICAV